MAISCEILSHQHLIRGHIDLVTGDFEYGLLVVDRVGFLLLFPPNSFLTLCTDGVHRWVFL